MKVLVACEFSGIVRDAFIERGHDAISCDLLPTERPGPHVQGDVRPLLKEPWDLVIAHPPCTHLTNLTWCWGNHYRIEGWWDEFEKAVAFFRECMNATAPRVAVENPPLMHPAAKKVIAPCDDKTDFMFFGDPFRKRVGWWLSGLPPLISTMQTINPPSVIRFRENAATRLEKPQNAHNGLYRDGDKARNRFSPGMARAMAQQWGSL